jgi:polysaccharide export outer membrane protein
VPDGINMALNSGYLMGNPERVGYLIDAEGNVQLPGLGTVQLAGLNRMEATAMLQDKISAFVDNPVVNIQILNFKVTILGEVMQPGTYRIPNERMTILEAIGLAGDLKMTGVRTNVLVIRDNDGSKHEYRVDLTDTAVFNSPAYYLQQNDVVYVEPNAAARTNASIWRATGSVFISLASLIVTTIVLITN